MTKRTETVRAETKRAETKRTEAKRSDAKPKPRRVREPVGAMTKPHGVPVIEPPTELERVPDQPFAEGALDAIDADLRQRMISETAYRLYAERGYADGYDVDDWVQAEAEVDHLLLNPQRA